ncbi:MAG: ABC transporter permease, partial [Coriobacteriia bacterium]|nr:ABC transporter permease [Coriobacteriia bacterium]
SEFADVIATLSQPGDDQILDMRHVETQEEADQLLLDGEIVGYFQIGTDANPRVYFSPRFTPSDFRRTILKDIADRFVRAQASIQTVAQHNPQALADPVLLTSLSDPASFTQQVTVTANESVMSVRYYFALLGMIAVLAANIALIGIMRTQANLSDLGARRAVGATSRLKTLCATFAACWIFSLVCLLIAYSYARFILDINFGSNDFAGILALACAALMATSLGALVGSIPTLTEGVKAGILTVIACFSALFAGLYGDPSMRLADNITRNFPYLQQLNPVEQVASLFYALYFYDSYVQFFQGLISLLIMSIVLFVGALLFLRRQRYAHI